MGASGVALVGLIERSLGAPESYPIVSSRHDLLRIAVEEGIRVPPTAPIGCVSDLASWQENHEFPWVLKGDGTFGGRGVRIAYTREQADQSFSEIAGMFGLMRALKRTVVNRDAFWLRP